MLVLPMTVEGHGGGGGQWWWTGKIGKVEGEAQCHGGGNGLATLIPPPPRGRPPPSVATCVPWLQGVKHLQQQVSQLQEALWHRRCLLNEYEVHGVKEQAERFQHWREVRHSSYVSGLG